MIYFLYHRSSRPTGIVLAEALKARHGEDYQVNSETIIRWGSRAYLGGAIPSRVVNNADALGRASDKLGSLQLMRDAGVQVPDWSTDPTDLEYPFLGRKLQHARGSDVVLCLQEGDYLRQPRDYYVKYIPTKREFRVHVVDGEVIRVQGKFLDEDELAVPWIRNHSHGYRFRSPRKQILSERSEMAVTAVRALGLDFGAVDLLIGDDNETYILEVNTAPACSPLTARKYITAFQRMLGLRNDQVDLDKLSALPSFEEDTAS